MWSPEKRQNLAQKLWEIHSINASAGQKWCVGWEGGRGKGVGESMWKWGNWAVEKWAESGESAHKQRRISGHIITSITFA